jgi:epoxyqueuosine reductase QueG
MGNSGDGEFLPTLRKLVGDSDPVVADHARWALDKLIEIDTKS